MTPADHNKYAILIGNQTYAEESGFRPLLCPHKDIDALQAVLEHEDHGGFTEVLPIKDGSREAILTGIQDILDKARREDLVFLYFSGHGKLDPGGKLYLAASDTNADRLLATGVKGNDINELIQAANVSKKAWVLDCCHAGAISREWKGADMIQTRVEEFARGSGTYVLAATDELDVAEEGHESGLSVMTQYLVEGLKGKADDNGDGIVTLRELSLYVQRKVVDFHNQRPIDSGLDRHGEVVISLSGVETEVKLRGRIRKQLLVWVKDEEIRDSILAKALGILAKGKALEAQEAKYRAIMNRIVDGGLRPGKFVSEWADLDAVPLVKAEESPEKIEPEKGLMDAGSPENKPNKKPEKVDAKPGVELPLAGVRDGITAAIGWIAIGCMVLISLSVGMALAFGGVSILFIYLLGTISLAIALLLMWRRTKKLVFGFVARQILLLGALASFVFGLFSVIGLMGYF